MRTNPIVQLIVDLNMVDKCELKLFREPGGTAMISFTDADGDKQILEMPDDYFQAMLDHAR